MEQNEHNLLLDIPSTGKNGKYHSAVLTTYSIDLIHFDNQLLNMLHRKQICSINVFADNNQMEKSMQYVSPFYMKNIGKEYSITTVETKGAFHPKINFFVGDEAVLMVFGTGNLTVCGHGKNHEAFTGFMVDESNLLHRPLIEESWQYISKFTKYSSDFERNRILNEIPANSTFLEPSYKVIPHCMHLVHDGLNAALLYNEAESSILQQIANLIPLNEVQKLTILSPYFDECGESLITLSELCPNAKINVLISKNCTLPPSNIPKNNRIEFYDFNETKRGKLTFRTYDRLLHAKIYHFKTNDSEYCIVGSANATVAGLGTLTKRGVNEEFCVLYQSSKLNFLSLLGLTKRKKIDMPIGRVNCYNNSTDEPKSKFIICSAQYEAGYLRVKFNKDIPTNAFLAVYNGLDVLEQKLDKVVNGEFTIDTKLEKLQYTCYLMDCGRNQISNKVFIHWTELLATTNPSQTSRNLNRFISKIENEGYDGMEVVDMLSDVMWDLVNDTDEGNEPKIKVCSAVKKEQYRSLPNIKYNPIYDNDDAKSMRIMHIDRTSRLIECIEESIKQKIKSMDDAINDEEEEGSAETSNNRNVEENNDINIKKNRIKEYSELSTSLLSKYKKMVERRSEQVRKNGNNTLTKDDLNFFSLSIFAAIEICYLNRSRYKFDEIDFINRSHYQKIFYDKLDRSIGFIGLETIEYFVRFCTTMKIDFSIDENIKRVASRTMKYAVLYGALFYKYSTQETLQVMWKRVLKAIGCLASILGMPSIDYLSIELSPLSERYDFVFRMRHIENILKQLSK